MDVTPSSPSRRARAKVVAKEPTALKPARKTLNASRKKSTEAAAVAVAVAPETIAEAAPAAPVDLHSRIATTAFYLAAERSFAPGRELDDWLEAERRVKASF